MKRLSICEAIIKQDIYRKALEIEEATKFAQSPPPPGIPAEVFNGMRCMMAWCAASMMKGMAAKWN